MKLIEGIQLVKIQPGQSRSGQAGSESCHSSGDGWVRSVDSKKVGRAGQLRNRFSVADADAVSLAEGCIGATVIGEVVARAAGVPSPWHAFIGIPQELGRTSPSPLPVGEVRGVEGDQRRTRRDDEASYEPIVPRKAGNWRRPGPAGGKGRTT